MSQQWNRQPHHYTEASAQARYEESSRQRDARGRWWIAPRIASNCTGHTKDTLNLWSKKGGSGCPALNSEFLERRPFSYGFGRTDEFYAEDQIDRLVEGERVLIPKVPGFVTREEAAATYGVCVATQKKLRKQGRLAQKEVRGRAKDGKGNIRKHTWILVSIKDLKAYRKRPETALVSPNKITTSEAAKLLGVHRDYVLPLAKARGLTIDDDDIPRDGTKSVVNGVYVRKGYLLDREQIKDECARREKPVVRVGRAFEFCGLIWLPTRLTLVRTGWHPSSLKGYREVTCPALDGRTENKPGKRRPVLALYVPVTKRLGRGSRWERAWFYCRDDVETVQALEDRRISVRAAVQRATAILSTAKAALMGTNVITNFAELDAPPPTVAVLPSGENGAAKDHDSPLKTSRQQRGRKRGWKDPVAQDRSKKVIEDWQTGRYATIAELARVHHMTRGRASQILHAAGLR